MKIVFAKTSSTVSLADGRVIFVGYGSHWSAADPVVKRYPQFFEEDPRFGLTYSDESAVAEEVEAEEDASGSVESTTAGPGERRQTRRG